MVLAVHSFLNKYLTQIIIGIVIVGSILGYGFDIPTSYFSYKRNVFNDYFVKIGWLWTCIIAILHMFIISTTKKDLPKREFVLLALYSIIWYTVTKFLFSFVIYFIPAIDISGHCFMLILSSLFIRELSLQTESNYKSLFVQGTQILTLVIRGIWLLMLFTTHIYRFHLIYDAWLGTFFGFAFHYLVIEIVTKYVDQHIFKQQKYL